ncbi:MAG: hypothetical protein ACP5TL_01100 [Candidatus Micrarchaeia archaeon]
MLYYSELTKIKKIERMLEKLAYLSVGFDALVALATFLVVRVQIKTIGSLLIISDYLVLIEVVVAIIIFTLLITLKYYKKIINNIGMLIFKFKHST